MNRPGPSLGLIMAGLLAVVLTGCGGRDGTSSGSSASVPRSSATANPDAGRTPDTAEQATTAIQIEHAVTQAQQVLDGIDHDLASDG